MRTPLTVATGVDPDALDAALVGLQWDMPDAVSVRHRIDPEQQTLSRVVSDATGVLEHELIHLEHACVSCALREDIVPTLERLADLGRWSSIVTCLPAGAEADQLATILARDTGLARQLRLTGVAAVLAGETVVDDLLGDDLLCERGVHHRPDDRRGLGEVACAMVEYADLVVLTAEPAREAADLVQALARPDAAIVAGAEHLDGRALTTPRHVPERTGAWVSPVLDLELPELGESRAWRLDLRSDRPFHPGRLLDEIVRLGGGRHRSRGCFHTPTRPGIAQRWDGAGGQLSIGGYGPWSGLTPMTRLLFTGVGQPPTDLTAAFGEVLATPDEHRGNVAQDGLEPWLGEIRDVA